MMTAATILLKADSWTMVSGVNGAGPYILRYREPLLSPAETRTHPQRLSVLWAYAPESSIELPTPEQSAEFERFENHLCDALEWDECAILVAVLTFDGARQWVLYTSDFNECGQRIAHMPHYDEPYPLEMSAEIDPDWSFLRNELLKMAPNENA